MSLLATVLCIAGIGLAVSMLGLRRIAFFGIAAMFVAYVWGTPSSTLPPQRDAFRSPPVTRTQTWADASRSLSAYGAKHREVHALLKTRSNVQGE